MSVQYGIFGPVCQPVPRLVTSFGMGELIGKKVVVFSDSSNGERQDIGVLEAAEGPWLKLHKGTEETLYFCLYNVRVVKPFEQ
jgi:hypothetical protein